MPKTCGIGKTVLSVSCARFKSNFWKSRPFPTLRQRNIRICPCLSRSTQISRLCSFSSPRQAEWTPVQASCLSKIWLLGYRFVFARSYSLKWCSIAVGLIIVDEGSMYGWSRVDVDSRWGRGCRQQSASSQAYLAYGLLGLFFDQFGLFGFRSPTFWPATAISHWIYIDPTLALYRSYIATLPPLVTDSTLILHYISTYGLGQTKRYPSNNVLLKNVYISYSLNPFYLGGTL